MRLAVIGGLTVFVVLVLAGFVLIVWNQYRLKPKPKATGTPVALIELKPHPRIDIRV